MPRSRLTTSRGRNDMGVITNLCKEVERLNRQTEILAGRVDAMREAVGAQNEVVRSLSWPLWKRWFKRVPEVTLKKIDPWQPEPEVTPQTVMGATVVGRIYEHK